MSYCSQVHATHFWPIAVFLLIEPKHSLRILLNTELGDLKVFSKPYLTLYDPEAFRHFHYVLFKLYPFSSIAGVHAVPVPPHPPDMGQGWRSCVPPLRSRNVSNVAQYREMVPSSRRSYFHSSVQIWRQTYPN